VKRQLGRRLARLTRGRYAHRILLRVLPRAIARRFDPAAANGLSATLELAIRGPGGAALARYELAIADARCSVRAGAPVAPAARAMIGSDDLILLASGAVGWPELLSSGRFELTGDPFLALRFATLFRLPVVLEPIA
jgi:SCP-2 sterol transfer family